MNMANQSPRMILSPRGVGRVLMTAGLLFISGCSSYGNFKELPTYQPVQIEQPLRLASTGSIYSATQNMVLFEDHRARQAGDVITVKLVEKTSASKEANSEVKKSNSSVITNPTLFGTTPEFNLSGLIPVASNSKNNLGANLSSDSNFKGEGDADQSNSLTGDITAVITRVLANGNLVIRGQKIMSLSRGEERIGLVGEVRPADISADNVVLSTRVANAHIVYDGKGQVADASKMGWIARFFVSALMPF